MRKGFYNELVSSVPDNKFFPGSASAGKRIIFGLEPGSFLYCWDGCWRAFFPEFPVKGSGELLKFFTI